MTENDEPQIYRKRYKIERKLGAGNFGTAYLVTDLKSKKEPKVLKVVRLGEMDENESVDAVREAELLSNLDNEHIVKFYESFLENDCLCIVTEFCDGGDLDQRLKELKKQNKPLGEDQVLQWLIEILIAVQYMHKSRILHRDLKARNIFLKNNQIKIGDFGISRVLVGTMDVATTFTGTPYYMSPEVMKHDGYKDRSDIWSVGCLLYEMCTFQHAFDGKGLMNVIYKVVEGKPPELPQKYSKELNDVLKKMFIKDPDRRPSAEEVLKSKFIQYHREKKHLNNPLENTINARSRLQNINTSFQTTSNYGKMKNENWSRQGKTYGFDEDPEEEPSNQITTENDDNEQLDERTLRAPQPKIIIEDKNSEIRTSNRGFAMEIPVKTPRKNSNDVGRRDFGENQRKIQNFDRPITPMKKTFEQIAAENGNEEEQFERASSPNRTRFGTLKENRTLSASRQQPTLNSMSQTINPRAAANPKPKLDPVQPSKTFAPKKPENSFRSTAKDHQSQFFDPFGPEEKERKIQALRIKAIQSLGEETFEKVHDYYVQQRTLQKSRSIDEKEIADGLKLIVDRTTNCFLVDQLVFFEMS